VIARRRGFSERPSGWRAAPRELTVLTEAEFEIEGEHPEKYVHEIEAEEVDSPVVAALQIQGRPFASSIIERLEALSDIPASDRHRAPVRGAAPLAGRSTGTELARALSK
jgi:hypothetical protein